ncbi:MAG: hypothetical protein AAGB04_02125 [Pseudomonadota bacterium]
MRLSRREAVALLVLSTLSISGAQSLFAGNRVEARTIADLLYEYWGNAASVSVAIGDEYLTNVPSEADIQVLSEHICPPWTSRHAELTSASQGDIHRLIDDWRREDFELGETVLVSGWLLSKTEARLCALEALRRTPMSGVGGTDGQPRQSRRMLNGPNSLLAE